VIDRRHVRCRPNAHVWDLEIMHDAGSGRVVMLES
jgi:hypothetical protein